MFYSKVALIVESNTAGYDEVIDTIELGCCRVNIFVEIIDPAVQRYLVALTANLQTRSPINLSNGSISCPASDRVSDIRENSRNKTTNRASCPIVHLAPIDRQQSFRS